MSKPRKIFDKPVSKTPITLLNNSIHYFLSWVLIVHEPGNYRLMVVHNKKLLMDEIYPTIRGAKIAFSKIYKRFAYCQSVKPVWSPVYSPYQHWLEEKKAFPLQMPLVEE